MADGNMLRPVSEACAPKEFSGESPGAFPNAFPWESHYPPGCRWDTPIEAMTVVALLDRGIAAGGDRIAFEYRGCKISFREFDRLANRLAAHLRGLGIRPGDAVGLYLPNTPWHPISVAALARLGARIVMMSLLDAPRMLAHKLRDSGARTIVTTDLAHALGTARALRDEDVVERVLVGEDARFGGGASEMPDDVATLASALAHDTAFTPHPAEPGDILFLQYTGGTTGLPKAAILTHANITAAAQIYRAWREGDAHPGAERVICVLPLFHIYGLSVVLFSNFIDGNTLLLRPSFDAAQTLRDIGEERATVFLSVPTMWLALLNHPDTKTTDFSSLRQVSCGGSPLPLEVAEAVGRLTGLTVTNGWGMTETSPAGTRLPRTVKMRPGLIGVPLPAVEMRIVSLEDPGEVLGPNETGEIAIRGPNVFQGYWNREDATKAAFRDGFFLTGDIGSVDEGGVFTLVDRKTNMIISSGYNVYPAVIEDAIYAHPDVAETIVIGVDDAYRGQAAKAFIKLKPGAPPITLEALRLFLDGRVGRHEMPQHLELRDELPKSPVGKLLASVLIAEERAKRAA